jgi:hypothetical protein
MNAMTNLPGKKRVNADLEKGSVRISTAAATTLDEFIAKRTEEGAADPVS